MENLTKFTQATKDQFAQVVTDLKELIRIPSVSSQAKHDADLDRSAEAVATHLRDLGMDVKILTAPTVSGEPGKPAVVGTLHDRPGQPTVLLYAHHDVQPVGDGAGWDTDPFTPTTKGDRLYGRGSADDGAGIAVHLGSLRVLGADRNVNVSVYIEGEEEIGSPSFKNFVREHRDLLNADVIVVADSSNWEVGYPAITTSLRGVVTADVQVRVTDHQMHSGMYGGPVLDAVTLAARLIATLHDANGDVAVAGLGGYDDVELDLDLDEFRANAGVVDSYQLAGTGSVASRLWSKPALSVIGWDQRTRENASNTITDATTFRLSLRTVPGTDSAAAFKALAEHLQTNAPFGAEVTVTNLESGPSYRARESRTITELSQALTAAYGREPLHTGLGGSIPFISDFEAIFPGADVVVTGVEDPKTNAHAENESVHLGDLEKNILAQALLLDLIGQRTA